MLTTNGKNRTDSIGADSALAGARIAPGAVRTNRAAPTTGVGVESQARIQQSFPADWPWELHMLLSFWPAPD